jgi:histidyl-tRNA synthetase
MFSGKQVPAVGVSLGIERVFAIKEQQAKDRNQVNISVIFLFSSACIMENSMSISELG